LSTSMETLSSTGKSSEEIPKATTLETLARAAFGALPNKDDKQADIVQVSEVLKADKLFELAVPKLAALELPRTDMKPATFRILLTELTTRGTRVSEGIPGIRDLWREMERYAGVTSRSQYDVDPTFVREDLKYRMLTQLSELSPIEVIYILSSAMGNDFMGTDSKFYASRGTFMRRVIRNSARTVSRQSRKWVSLSILDKEAGDMRTPEQISAQVFGKGSIFSPRPWLAHMPLGKQGIAPHDFVDGSNGTVSPLVHGLANFWLRVVYQAAAPKYNQKEIAEYMQLAGVHYRNELNMLVAADAVIYPEGGPVKTPSNVSGGNDANFEVRWMLQTRTRFANRTMIPYLGVEGYTRTLSNQNREVMKRLKREIIQVIARTYAGRLDCHDRGLDSLSPDLAGPWKALNRGMMKLNAGTISFSSVPETIRLVLIKELTKAVREPKKLLKSAPVSLPNPPKNAAEMRELDEARTSSLPSSISELAEFILKNEDFLTRETNPFGYDAEAIQVLLKKAKAKIKS